jgi:hypothetical protein
MNKNKWNKKLRNKNIKGKLKIIMLGPQWM